VCLAPGYRADLNIIDFGKLGMRMHEVVYDLPAGGRRLMQRADGYRHTFVAESRRCAATSTPAPCRDELLR
jgi:N-acyl-D-aspartate/D-glutamate deacylase